MSALVTDAETPALGETATAVFGPAQPCRRHPGRPTTVCAGCHPYRYELTRTWDRRRPPATFLMLNPSTADALTDDPTIRRCIGYARTWACGGLVVINTFALRSTDPRALYGHADPIGPDNDRVIGQRLTRIAANGGPLIAAWGAHGVHLDRHRQVAALTAQRGVQMAALAITKGGHPGHPLYLPRTARPVPYEPLETR
ncbi:DUF1643 domain-containing protein [Micromonospora aurantiaca (nom. illeg.)]|uniref:DUF1643 domain-containing protein n=1 Tax=Micromonospora aurantiaca (nom. illeg.) TaxID=47850 RepID=UPI0011A19A15|nr:DUF1643 domain-containing protein [Micromonospora aurantiaca]MBC9005165.1 DUF1643 domain-containing protein [Micromonospora aurantiaca]